MLFQAPRHRRRPPGFHVGAKVHLEGPRCAGLSMEEPIIFGDVLRVQNSVRLLEGVAFRKPVPDELRVDCAIDDDMGDMNVLWAKFAGHALRQRAQSVFSAGEGGKSFPSAHGSGCSGKEDGSAPARQHRAGGFAAREEPREEAISQTLKYFWAVVSRMPN